MAATREAEPEPERQARARAARRRLSGALAAAAPPETRAQDTAEAPPVGGPLVRPHGPYTQEEIRAAMHVATVLHEEKAGGRTVSTANPLERAARYTGFGETKLRDLWVVWKGLRGEKLPPVMHDYSKPHLCGAVPRSLFPELRQAIRDMRINRGHGVEVPDVQKWLKETHNLVISRNALRHSMHRMGFVFGRLKKYTLRREAADIVAKRKAYIKALYELEEERQQRLQDGKKPLVFVYLDESYVNRNHSLGMTWYHPDDDEGNAVALPRGKGERLVMLTAITSEYGMLQLDEELRTLMLFQARKATGDYHENMNADAFCEWVEEQLLPALEELKVDAVLIMDNASYHCTPAPGCIIPSAFKTKKDIIPVLKKYDIKFREGKAPKGESLEDLQARLQVWLDFNAEKMGLKQAVLRVEEICREKGHRVLFTPPYHPELQPIEELWRDVKMYVARHFAGCRSMKDLTEQVREGFLTYGTAAHCQRKIARAWKQAEEYLTGKYDPAPATDDEDESDDEGVHHEDQDQDQDEENIEFLFELEREEQFQRTADPENWVLR